MPENDAARLGTLSGLLFDRAATLWYGALGLELLSSVASAIIGLSGAKGELALTAALVVIGLIAAAYVTRLVAEDQNETAQTMRRQAALSEGLGWPLEPVQLEEWRRKAGPKLLRRVAAEPREEGYYGTQQATGPRRLAEMTRESAFYTRHLYLWIRSILGVGLAAVALALAAVMYLALANSRATTLDTVIAEVVATVVLIAISVDAAGWTLRLTRQAGTIREIERGLDRLLEAPDVDVTDVLRLVAEYDCALANSIPIHPVLFRAKHDDIRELWEHRARI